MLSFWLPFSLLFSLGRSQSKDLDIQGLIGFWGILDDKNHRRK